MGGESWLCPLPPSSNGPNVCGWAFKIDNCLQFQRHYLRIINSTAMTQSFWQNFAILGGATFLYPVFIMLTSAVEMSWVFFKCDWHGNIRRDEPINCMYEKLFCSMRFNATSRTKNRCTVETSNLFWKKKISKSKFDEFGFFPLLFLMCSRVWQFYMFKEWQKITLL